MCSQSSQDGGRLHKTSDPGSSILKCKVGERGEEGAQINRALRDVTSDHKSVNLI